MMLGVLLAAAPLVLLVLFAQGAVFARSAMQPYPVDCEETETFLGGAVPAEATDVRCRDDGGVMDRGYRVDFRLPGERAGSLLTAAYPRLTDADPSPCDADLCLEGGDHDQWRDHALSWSMDVTVTHRSDGSADVHIDAHDV
ncbi:hypothetical protein ACFYXS_23970 [Streptomyces sp. NPDC002574]|uniref:hypothetical protein n=1 Tax=Streptomyces sp. NPDC002574 TaxID=3364652 RepID=UPI0036872FA4